MDEEFPKLVANPGNSKNTKQDKKQTKKSSPRHITIKLQKNQSKKKSEEIGTTL